MSVTFIPPPTTESERELSLLAAHIVTDISASCENAGTPAASARGASTFYGLFWNNRHFLLSRTIWRSPGAATGAFNRYLRNILRNLPESAFITKHGIRYLTVQLIKLFKQWGILQVRPIEVV